MCLTAMPAKGLMTCHRLHIAWHNNPILTLFYRLYLQYCTSKKQSRYLGATNFLLRSVLSPYR